MEGYKDFSFCQVGDDVNEHQLESPKGMPNISKVTIKDGSSEDDKHEGPTSNVLPSPVDISPNTSLVDNGKIDELVAQGSLPSMTAKMEPPKPISSEVLGSKMSESSKDSVKTSDTNPLIASKRPRVRTKVPFEKGYSQMDWLRVTRTHPDLAGLNGRSNRRLITMDEVKQHKTEGSIWTVLKGRVYNISPYMKFHPGGEDMLMKAAGKDCTTLFNKYHAWVNAEFLLEKCLVGILDVS
ncbi:hypothetical protein AMTRI_Chr09g12760 [Amborella trichopoda]|uniref:cytochrome b5 domain-containing protein RLF isoform X1 n=2 Tax=Amborella trichopoda TaxID=13333 RepID=UPI0005D4248E|nr:cytochrome b5 domain-containing protein RLF isoform X1 [Amborella trichopoda]XP_011624638.1 cytochrome b5 domain-containing protein RLF isoform X1 [Amborella trichopoda]XP_011624639.1 cytochrome b5 domain-containing protein RLF isoform X1 [Amborella trichopoda]XP_020524978.1 cytochrome b5 domain-containing protein RLF isoform X1 [Amborella trichopoda]XP_020524979.1 cytochrome b5 domain-containing protein RLF isoform X1 [Amborella trichopoda]XP_020524980.1 cytochrome b5 domain-containing pro|eukprot:XP_011624637.1 cytochrome b5 domain-containing protein RLF isoform X1 [Amborella trichopoda]